MAELQRPGDVVYFVHPELGVIRGWFLWQT